MDHRQNIDRLVAAIDNWLGGAIVPPWFDPEPGETVYGVFPGVELIELREIEPPLIGGSGALDVAVAAAMTATTLGARRSIWLTEAVPARQVGSGVVTSKRLVFVGDIERSWRFEELTDLTHDEGVPETWLAVGSRKRISGLRYPGGAAVDLRFTIALAIATARDERAALRAWVLSQRETAPAVYSAYGPAAPAYSAYAPAGPAPADQAAWLVTAKRGLRRVYLGKQGSPLPLRIGQGVLAGLITLALFGSVLPDSPSAEVKLAGSENSVEKIDEAAQQAEIDARKKAAAEEQARLDAERVAAEQAAADKTAAENAAAEKAAAEQAAAEQAAAEKAAAEQAAAEKAAAEQAAAQKAAADKAAADAAAQAAARAEAERQAKAKAAAPTGGGKCLPEYPDFCIPAGPDLDCPDIGRKNFTVLRPDSFRFDADNDGVGCES